MHADLAVGAGALVLVRHCCGLRWKTGDVYVMRCVDDAASCCNEHDELRRTLEGSQGDGGGAGGRAHSLGIYPRCKSCLPSRLATLEPSMFTGWLVDAGIHSKPSWWSSCFLCFVCTSMHDGDTVARCRLMLSAAVPPKVTSRMAPELWFTRSPSMQDTFETWHEGHARHVILPEAIGLRNKSLFRPYERNR